MLVFTGRKSRRWHLDSALQILFATMFKMLNTYILFPVSIYLFDLSLYVIKWNRDLNLYRTL